MTIDTKALTLAIALLLPTAATGAEPKPGAAGGDQKETQSKPIGETPAPSGDADAEAKRKAVQERMKEILATPTPVGPFPETTKVDGKIPVDLGGVWLLVAHAKLGEVEKVPKLRNFVQLLKVSPKADGKLDINMLDVRLPIGITEGIEKSNSAFTAWQPQKEDLATLRSEWSKLPPYTEKTLNEHIYLDVTYIVAAPDRYEAALPKSERSPDILDGTGFALHVLERYKPGKTPTDSPVSITQVAGRTSIYGFKPNGDNGDRLTGPAVLRFAAVGASSGVPLAFASRVTMYRVAPLGSS